MKPIFFLSMLLMSFTLMAKEVSFITADQAKIYGLYYPKGSQAVVLAHGAVFNKESWEPLAKQLVASNITVLAIDFRGYGKSTVGEKNNALYEDILTAVRYLRQQKNISNITVLGASMGGKAAAEAVIHAKSGEINKLILLSPMPVAKPENLQSDILYIASENEGVIETIKSQFQKAPKPKKLQLLKGSAHAQHIFKTEQADELTNLILKFLLSSSKN